MWPAEVLRSSLPLFSMFMLRTYLDLFVPSVTSELKQLTTLTCLSSCPPSSQDYRKSQVRTSFLHPPHEPNALHLQVSSKFRNQLLTSYHSPCAQILTTLSLCFNASMSEIPCHVPSPKKCSTVSALSKVENQVAHLEVLGCPVISVSLSAALMWSKKQSETFGMSLSAGAGDSKLVKASSHLRESIFYSGLPQKPFLVPKGVHKSLEPWPLAA